MAQMVFLPFSRARAAELRAGTSSDEVVGHAATQALLHLHGYDSSSLEDAEFAALSYAGVRAVADGAEPLRLVLAADVPVGQVLQTPDDPYGEVAVRGLRWVDVQALFSDEQAATAAVAEARQVAAGQSLADALERPAVQHLLDEHDLLWFAPEELDQLP